MHLQSIQFDEDDYEYLEEISQKPYPNIAPTRLLKKIMVGFEKRATQVQKVAEHKNNFTGKTIVCGDFNDTSVSYAYHTLAKGMQDSFSKKGFLFGKTFVNPTPFLKIDHVFLHNSFKVNSHRVINQPYSDHYPVIVTFSKN
jgi:endonuclease/exonuclease/phosphatase family metal-dependent hydrolase